MLRRQLWLLVYFFPIGVLAQRPALYFEKLDVQNGLSHNKVNCILQDQRGFIWLGTDDGLNRYDGKRFVHFKSITRDSTTLSGNIITDMLEDDQGLIWIATADGGLSRYDWRLPPLQQFKRYNQLHNRTKDEPLNTINALLDDKSGYLWLGTSGSSVLRFDKRTGAVKDVVAGTKTTLDLIADASGTIWVGRQGGGLLKINPTTLSYTEDARYNDLYAKLPHVAVTSLFKDRQGFIWFGSWDKVLYRYNAASGTKTVYQQSDGLGFHDDEVHCFAEDAQGNLWMGGKDKGLQVYDFRSGRFHQYLHNPAIDGSLASNRVNCIFIDRSGTTWLGTNNGVSVSNSQKQKFRQQFLPTARGEAISIYDLLEQPDGERWLGTSAGLFVQKGDGPWSLRKLYYKGEPLQVSQFFRDSNGVIYMGTNKSLFQYDVLRNSVRPLANTEKDGVMRSIISSRITSITQAVIDGRPVLMVAPYGHYLAYYDFTNQRWISRLDSSKIVQRFGLTDFLIRKFFPLPDGGLLLATSKGGLGWWPAHDSRIRFYTYQPNNPVSPASNHISDICNAGSSKYWVSTMGGGLYLFDLRTQSFTRIRATHNLIEGIKTDQHGRVWMVSNGHLQMYDPLHNTYSTYELPDAGKTGGVRGDIFRDSKGFLYVSGTNFFIKFHPDSISNVKSEPMVFLTDLQIFNQSFSHLLQQGKVSLQNNQNYFTFEFAAPDFSPGQGVRYAYMLEGFDKDWIEAGERNYVSYSNLAGGHYIFRVKATNTPGTWSRHQDVLHLEVVPPYWKQLWFYILCGAIIAVVTYGAYRYRINELLKRQAIRNRIAQDLHDNVGSTLSSISVYSQVAKIYQQKDQEAELRHALEKISSTSTEMISELNDTVWAINPRNDSMEVMLQRMESFARPLLAAQGIAFHFEYDPALAFLPLDMEKRKSFYAVFKESVNNAVKYSECSQVTVTIRRKGRYLFLKTSDDGKGFDLSTTSEGFKSSDVFGGGNGLKNMQQRATAMQGELTMKSELGKGTIVELRIPIP